MRYWSTFWHRVGGLVVGAYEDEHLRRIGEWRSYCVYPHNWGR